MNGHAAANIVTALSRHSASVLTTARFSSAEPVSFFSQMSWMYTWLISMMKSMIAVGTRFSLYAAKSWSTVRIIPCRREMMYRSSSPRPLSASASSCSIGIAVTASAFAAAVTVRYVATFHITPRLRKRVSTSSGL